MMMSSLSKAGLKLPEPSSFSALQLSAPPEAESPVQKWDVSGPDIMVIFALFSFTYIRSWFYFWYQFTYNLNLQRVSTFLFMVLSVKCVSAISLAAITDLRHGKYKVYMYFLFMYAVFPLYGILEVYFPSFTLRLVMAWIHSWSEMIFPVQMAAVFNQKPSISRTNSYICLTVFWGIHCLLNFLLPWVIPFRCPLPEDLVITIWVIITLSFVQVIIFVIYARKHARPEFFAEKHLRHAIAGIQIDRQTQNDAVLGILGRKTARFWAFALMLLPVVYSIFLYSCLEPAAAHMDVNMPNWRQTDILLSFGEMIGVPVIGGLLLCMRSLYPRLTDILILGLPHLLSLLAVAIILGRLIILRGGLLVGPIPDDSSMVMHFINADYNNRSICIQSDHFEPVRIRAMETEAIVVRTKKPKIKLIIVLDPLRDNYIPSIRYVDYRQNSLGIYIVQIGTVTLEKNYTLDALLMHEVSGVEHVRIGKSPQLVWMTSIDEFQNGTELSVAQGGDSFLHSLPTIDEGIVEEIPLLDMTILVSLKSSESDKFEILAQASFLPAPHTVYGVMIHEHNSQASLAAKNQRMRPSTSELWPSRMNVFIFELMKTAVRPSARLPEESILRKDPVLGFAYFILGAATASTVCGFLHLMWMDSPRRLRTTLFAFASSLHWILSFIPKLRHVEYYAHLAFWQLGVAQVSILFIFQFLFTALHFLLAFYFYIRLPNEPSAKPSSTTAPLIEQSQELTSKEKV